MSSFIADQGTHNRLSDGTRNAVKAFVRLLTRPNPATGKSVFVSPEYDGVRALYAAARATLQEDHIFSYTTFQRLATAQCGGRICKHTGDHNCCPQCKSWLYLKMSVDQLTLRIEGVLAALEGGRAARLPRSKEWSYLGLEGWCAPDLKDAKRSCEALSIQMRARCDVHLKLDLSARSVVIDLVELEHEGCRARGVGGGEGEGKAAVVHTDDMERVPNPQP
ncbi:hypothetical protein T484DRAFT_1860250 [Baffinella frigidus]|nr:hypothetical protein T484DRAFT_1860250 [Cryptophyta sp. CCMP2293]